MSQILLCTTLFACWVWTAVSGAWLGLHVAVGELSASLFSLFPLPGGSWVCYRAIAGGLRLVCVCVCDVLCFCHFINWFLLCVGSWGVCRDSHEGMLVLSDCILATCSEHILPISSFHFTSWTDRLWTWICMLRQLNWEEDKTSLQLSQWQTIVFFKQVLCNLYSLLFIRNWRWTQRLAV